MAERGEDNFALLEWRVDNFGCWNENFHFKMIPSPKLQVSSAVFSCTFHLFPRGLTCSDQHMGLFVSYYSELELSGEITFVGSDGRLLCAQRVEAIACGKQDLVCPPGPKFKEVVEDIRKNEPMHKDSLTLRLRIRNVPPWVHRVRTEIKAIDTTVRMLRGMLFAGGNPSWRSGPWGEALRIANIPPFLSDEGTVSMALEALIEDPIQDSKVQLKFRHVLPEGEPEQLHLMNNFLVYTRLSVLDHDDVVLSSEDKEHVFVNEREWTFSQSMTRKEIYYQNFGLLLRFKIVPSRLFKHETVCEFDPEIVDVFPTFRTEHHFASVPKESDLSEDSVRVLSKHLSGLYQDQEFSDFRLKCENVTFPVHRNILAARSPVFKAMLSSDMKEAASGCVDIVDLDAPTLSLFLAFLYTGKVDLQGESAPKLYRAADKYQVPSLKKVCSDFLSANVSNSNVQDILSLSRLGRNDQLITAALQFMLDPCTAKP